MLSDSGKLMHFKDLTLQNGPRNKKRLHPRGFSHARGRTTSEGTKQLSIFRFHVHIHGMFWGPVRNKLPRTSWPVRSFSGWFCAGSLAESLAET